MCVHNSFYRSRSAVKDEHLQKLEREIDFLSNDLKKLHQIADVANTLRCPHQSLDEGIKELTRDLQRQLTDRQTNDPQLSILDLSLHSSYVHNAQLPPSQESPSALCIYSQV